MIQFPDFDAPTFTLSRLQYDHYNVFIQNNIIFCILADFDQYKYIIGLYVHCILDSVHVRVYFHFLFQVTYQADWEKWGC